MAIIEAKNIGKKYYIGERQPYLTMRDALANIFRSPTHWLRRKVTKNNDDNAFWALKEIDFKVEQGEVLGIIGRNGAGKSTLLKILSRITPPTVGELSLQGNVGSLLEVGTGFHPELTGRENIFLNGAILGMRRQEIVNKLDEIIEFSGVEKFIDTPVKRYSSGMYVRLAFSVAAHLETDILIVDEVLSVGDAEFQKKCLGKMGEVTHKEGRTVLFVSHNMTAVRSLCSRVILLKDGHIEATGQTDDILQLYSNDTTLVTKNQTMLTPNFGNEITFTKIWITNSLGEITNKITDEEGFRVWVEFQVSRPTKGVEISLCLRNSSNVNVIFCNISDSSGGKLVSFERGKHVASAAFKGNFLLPDNYAIRLSAHIRGIRDIELYQDVLHLIIVEAGISPRLYGQVQSLACVFSNTTWEHHKLSDA